MSDRNYEIAWNLLRERYDNKRVIVHTHIKAITELPSMNKENACELRQIADGASKHIHVLQALGRPIYDDLLVHVVSSKLDSLTLREWQNSLTGQKLPTFKQLASFITHRCQALEATGKSDAIHTKNGNARSTNEKQRAACVATVKFKCTYCSGEHSIYSCKNFLALPVPCRNSEIRKLKVCYNCLRSTTHIANKCPSGNCRVCKAKHNTLLHESSTPEKLDGDQENNPKPSSATTPTALVAHVSHLSDGKYVMLSTAAVYVYNNAGARKLCRVLLDCGSRLTLSLKASYLLSV
ncbi:uncharacterized protein LOC112453228 [Temnothorax curvispinosus]|uniref:Uncharacterized protein LOC112453228 n=1 Tax=Temnothorax curvispinosus TaxID=300111 RepID=A0A6J1PJP4_9HYME|nr:uncharacterized protein LOC112453228 [Temnothorax curvispinosus]